ncbi:replication endonuclease [Aliarcobacter butzleri]|uniref:replication endonuclease n=1 Tax=Aliarcobacter butzleri TaxID=28197 RepID=UPI002B2418BF|nr:replication endonuclease [Aliarcobacter butzleri]
MQSYEKYIKTQRLEYIQHSKIKEDKQSKYKSKLESFNHLSGEFKSMIHNPLQVSKDNYLWFTFNQKLLEEQIIASGNYATLFITLTLPSKFHKYSQQTKKYNPLYNEQCTINEGYNLLNKSFRTIYKDFKVNRKFEKIYFSKVIEPHKNLSCHLHAILYVNIDNVEYLKNHIKNVVVKNELGRYEIEEIKDITRGTSYLLKYVQKTTNPSNDKDFHFFNGWKKYNKIRVFTCSIVGIERYLFKKINASTSITKNLKGNPIAKMLQECDINITTTNTKTNEINTKSHMSLKSRFIVEVEKEKFTQDVNYTPNEKETNRIFYDSFLNGSKNNIMKTYNLRGFLNLCKAIFGDISEKKVTKKIKYKLIENYKKYIINYNNYITYKSSLENINIIESFLNNEDILEISEFDIDNHGRNLYLEDVKYFDKKLEFERIFEKIYIPKYKYKIKKISIFDKKLDCEIYTSSSFEILWKMLY